MPIYEFTSEEMVRYHHLVEAETEAQAQEIFEKIENRYGNPAMSDWLGAEVVEVEPIDQEPWKHVYTAKEVEEGEYYGNL